MVRTKKNTSKMYVMKIEKNNKCGGKKREGKVTGKENNTNEM